MNELEVYPPVRREMQSINSGVTKEYNGITPLTHCGESDNLHSQIIAIRIPTTASLGSCEGSL